MPRSLDRLSHPLLSNTLSRFLRCSSTGTGSSRSQKRPVSPSRSTSTRTGHTREHHDFSRRSSNSTKGVLNCSESPRREDYTLDIKPFENNMVITWKYFPSYYNKNSSV